MSELGETFRGMREVTTSVSPGNGGDVIQAARSEQFERQRLIDIADNLVHGGCSAERWQDTDRLASLNRKLGLETTTGGS